MLLATSPKETKNYSNCLCKTPPPSYYRLFACSSGEYLAALTLSNLTPLLQDTEAGAWRIALSSGRGVSGFRSGYRWGRYVLSMSPYVAMSDHCAEQTAQVSSWIREIRHLYEFTLAVHSVVPGEGGVGLVFLPANTNNPPVYMATLPDGSSSQRRRTSGGASQAGSGHRRRSGNSASNTTLASQMHIPHGHDAPQQLQGGANMAPPLPTTQYADPTPSQSAGMSYAGGGHGANMAYPGAASSPQTGMSYAGGGQHPGAAPSAPAGMSFAGGGQHPGAASSPQTGMSYAGGGQHPGAAPSAPAGMSFAGGGQHPGAAPLQPAGMSYAGGSQRGGNVPPSPALTRFAAAAAPPPPASMGPPPPPVHYATTASSQRGVTFPSGGQFALPSSSMQRQPSLSGTVASSNTSFTATSVSSTGINNKYAVIAPGSTQPEYFESLKASSKASLEKHRKPSTTSQSSKSRRSSQRLYRSSEDFSSHSRGNAPYPSFRIDLQSDPPVDAPITHPPADAPITHPPADAPIPQNENEQLLRLLHDIAIACRQAGTVVPLEFILEYVPEDYEFPLQTLVHMGYVPAVLGNVAPDVAFTPITRGNLVILNDDVVVVLNAAHRVSGSDMTMFTDLVRVLRGLPSAAHPSQPAAAYTMPASAEHPVGHGHDQQYQPQAGPSSGVTYHNPGVQEGGDGAGGVAPSSGWGYGGGSGDGQYHYDNYSGPS